MTWTGKVLGSKISDNGLVAIITQRFTRSDDNATVDFDSIVPGSIASASALQGWVVEQRGIIIDMLIKRDAAINLIEQKIGS